MTPFIALFVLIATVLSLLIFVIINSAVRTRKEMKKEYEHIMKNLKNVSELIMANLDNKHDEIEATGKKYIELIKENVQDINYSINNK